MGYPAHQSIHRWKPPERRMSRSAPATPDLPATKVKNSWASPDSAGVLAGDSPYIKGKHAQLIDKDLNKAVPLFWNAINAGDHVASALKDMAVVMKQLNRAEEGIEAIKSFRSLCTPESQDSLDNLLLDLYKKCGRLAEQVELLQYKLKMLNELTSAGKKKKMVRSQGKRFYITTQQEESRLLGNLAWAYLQQGNYGQAEEAYREALRIEPDDNKKCNLAVCLMKKGEIEEAKSLVESVIYGSSSLSSTEDMAALPESCLKSLERACQMLDEIELQASENAHKVGQNGLGLRVHGNREERKASLLHSGNWANVEKEGEASMDRGSISHILNPSINWNHNFEGDSHSSRTRILIPSVNWNHNLEGESHNSRSHILTSSGNWNHNFEGESLVISGFGGRIPTHNLNSEDFEGENWNPNIQAEFSPRIGQLGIWHTKSANRQHIGSITIKDRSRGVSSDGFHGKQQDGTSGTSYGRWTTSATHKQFHFNQEDVRQKLEKLELKTETRLDTNDSIFSPIPNTATRVSSVNWANSPSYCSLKPELDEFPRRPSVRRSLSSQFRSCSADENQQSQPEQDHVNEYFFLPDNLFDVTP